MSRFPLNARPRGFSAWVICCLLLSACRPLAADEYRAFEPALPAGTKCRIEVARLRPTQWAVGLKEVQLRAVHVRGMRPKRLARYLREKEVPVVIGPGGHPYVLDHHHLARTLLEAGLPTPVYATIRENWSRLTEEEFWQRMRDHHWLYLYDETGRGPLDPAQLPPTIAAMRDDPYRSLAWLVRERGGYAESPELYADFQWANFFRARIPPDEVRDRWDDALNTAFKLARSSEAKGLPGYLAPPAADRGQNP